MLNALTIDIEDYFQVHAFSSIIRCENWESYECRVEQNTDRLLNILNGPTHNSKKGNSITRDLNNSLTRKLKATFFILGWIAERYPDLVRRIQNEGHEIACHGYSHKLIYNQSKEEFRDDIKKAKAILEDITGSEVIGYRAPSYSITNRSQWAFEVLIEEGFKYDSSIFPIRHDFYGFPTAPRFPFVICLNGNSNVEFSMLNFELGSQNSKLTTQNSKLKINNSIAHSINKKVTCNPVRSLGLASDLKRSGPLTSNILLEFPLSTARFGNMNFPISGGGYFRLFPYRIIKSGLQRINEREGKPFVFYIHPWEIDPGQPKVDNLCFRSRFRHYANLNKTEPRFRKLLEDFHFSTIKDVINLNFKRPSFNN